MMKLICMININVKIEMTQGQGHEVKGQGQTWSYEKIVVSRVNHERTTGSL